MPEIATIPIATSPQHGATDSVTVYYEFHIDGARCMGCVNKIERHLESMPLISSARLTLSLNRLKVSGPTTLNSEDIVRAVQSLGYEATSVDADSGSKKETDENKELLKMLAAAAFGAGNVMILSLAVWTGAPNGMGPATITLFSWLSALVALPVVAYAGRPFFNSAWQAIKAHQINMDVPISLALLLTCGMSLYQLTVEHGETYFEAATTLTFFLLIGRYLDKSARTKARAAIEGLLAFTKTTARVINGEGMETMAPASSLREGFIVLVHPGEHIPGDGIIETGTSELDTAPITGEALPASAEKGDRVFGGTLNLTAPLTVRIDTAAKDNLANKTIALMESAEQRRTKYVQLANRAAAIYAPTVHGLAAAAFLGWWLIGGLIWQDALFIAVSVLIITCPCALALAVPAVQIVANGRLFARGILQKSADGLERLCNISHVVFDKTGTITTGEFTPHNLDQIDANILSLAANLARHSSHPLCRALSQAVPTTHSGGLSDFQEIAGKGIAASLDGKMVRFGNRSFCNVLSSADDTYSEAFFVIEGQTPVRFTFRETLRPDTRDTITELDSLKLPCRIASGDRAAAVEHVAARAGILDWQAGLLPTDKAALVDQARDSGQHVLMVGDGLNDGPALSGAYVSMTPASGLDVSTSRADLVFRTPSLSAVTYAIGIARQAKALMRQNLFLALLYNIVAVPIAIAGLASPPVAAIAMSLSSVVVTANALRLRKGT